jgi:hypothetical protein
LVYPPVHHLLLEKFCFGEMDNYLKTLPITGYGKSPFYGGTDALLAPVGEFPYLFKGDIFKMDVHSIPQQWRTLSKIRCAVSSEHLHRRIKYCYEVKESTFLWLSDGTIITAKNQQKSGSGATSSDNTWWHLVLFIYMCLEACDKIRLPPPETFDEVLKIVHPVMFSDDHVAGTKLKLIQSLEFRKEIYRRFGYTLKPEEDLVTTNIEDLTFLGGKLHKTEIGIVPVYNGDKMISLFRAREKPSYDPSVIYSTLLSYCLLCTFDPDWFDVFYKMLQDVCRDYDYPSYTRYEFKKMFMRNEFYNFCSGLGAYAPNMDMLYDL